MIVSPTPILAFICMLYIHKKTAQKNLNKKIKFLCNGEMNYPTIVIVKNKKSEIEIISIRGHEYWEEAKI
ncbi:hypothetical protein CW304_07930 [Bacillus sp. UFRGS-B20]|nr:hypothetical protein CW304_07930 [Bacillus sp. UFRGS-B20]